MSLFNQLFTASYNGVPFFVDTSEMVQGRKTKTFEYPNKKYRYVEDLGENLKTFTVSAVVTGGDDYLIRREALILALQRKGMGVLTHPFYGLVFVTVITYTVSENMTSLGECLFHITFQETRENIFPVEGEESIASIQGLINEIAPYLEAHVVTSFALLFKRNTTDAAAKCVALNQVLTPNRPVAVDNNVLNDFWAQNNSFLSQRYYLLQNNTNLADSIYNLINSYNDLGQSDSDQYTMNQSVYYFGNTDVSFGVTTAERQERFKNRLVLNCYINALLLMSLYANAIQITYLDDQQVSLVENDLEEKYQYLMLNNNFESEVLSRLETIRNSVKKFFNNLKVNISKVITVTVPKTPLSVLLYRYYANFDNEEEVISLNELINMRDISGEIKILTGE